MFLCMDTSYCLTHTIFLDSIENTKKTFKNLSSFPIDNNFYRVPLSISLFFNDSQSVLVHKLISLLYLTLVFFQLLTI